jgi:dTDP-4-amino-4,6-dideoxygalactose transaminase
VTIPLVDLTTAYRELKEEIDDAVARVTASGWYIGGPEVDRFEEEWADYCGADHCVGVANGFDALHLSLRALGIGPGDEVILASNSYIATVLAVSIVGATPVMVEPDPATYNLDASRVESAINSQTRALLPTHLYGQPADLDPLLEIARVHGLRLIEDAAQAHGATYKNRRVGSHGDIVAWSFYPTKNLGAMGDGGAITTDNPELARNVRLMGNYGFSQRYVAETKGVNSRLDPLQAAILRVKLQRLDEWNARRRSIAASYREHISGATLRLPYVPAWADPVWHLYVIQSVNRDRLAADLAEAGIQTMVHYPIPPHLQRAYANLGYRAGTFPLAEELATSVLSLPIGPHLSTDDAARIARVTKSAVGTR